ncbi:MAG: hypothetical protein ACUVTB_00285 [Candidatus Bathycorpusculaceae bacterium]
MKFGFSMETFPERIYTREEVKKAKELVDKGYKHRLRVKGSAVFKEKVRQAIKLVKTAGYYDFLRMYIRCITEIEGLTQLRESEASIWANRYAVENPVDAASLFVQKAHHMKDYLESKLYYGGMAEKRSVLKRIEFLKVLKERSRENIIKEECERLLKLWDESSLVY